MGYANIIPHHSIPLLQYMVPVPHGLVVEAAVPLQLCGLKGGPLFLKLLRAQTRHPEAEGETGGI